MNNDAKRREDEDAADLGRLLSLSDGIFAFGMTLLAVNVGLPNLEANLNEKLVKEQVTALVPSFFVFAVTFLVVGLYWISHRRIFRYLIRSDTPLTWLNILLLLFIALLPVTSGLYDSYGDVQLVAEIYIGTLLLIAILELALWVYGTFDHRLVEEKLEQNLIRYYTFISSIPVVVFVTAMVVTLIDPGTSRYLLLAFLVAYPFLGKLADWVFPRFPLAGTDSPSEVQTAAQSDGK